MPSSDVIADPESSKAPGAESGAAMSASCYRFSDAATTAAQRLEIVERSFYVHFSTCPPGVTSDALALSDAAYKLREVDELNRAKETIRLQLTKRTSVRLRNMGVAAENCERLARLVMDGKRVKINADVDEPRSMEDIYELYRYLKDVESYQCLLISAPEMGNERNPRERRQEMENFCLQAFPPEHFSASRLDHTITWREVSNCTQVRTFVRDFFRRSDGVRAKRALHAMIVFFGHGSEQGFCAGHEDMPLNDIILFVKDEWREALLQSPEELPVKVEIIFTQCYGHLHDQVVQNDRFKVTALTSVDNVLTTSSAENAAVGFVNDNLTPYAMGTLRSEVGAIETWRHSDDKNVVDLSAAHRSRSEDKNEPDRPTTSTEDDGMLASVNNGGPSST